MKIPLQNYPLLDPEKRKKVLNDEVFRMTFYAKLANSKHPGDKIHFKQFREFIDHLAETEKIQTRLIATTVSNYMFTKAEPIMNKLWKFIPELENKTGCILWQGWTYFYHKFEHKGEGVILYLIGNHETLEWGCVVKEPDDETRVLGTPPEESTAKTFGFMMSTLFLPFLEFAESETIVLNSKKTKKAKIDKEKYITDIPYDIEIVDSRWFITIIRTEGFKVTGHFRLQRVGIGRMGRKLTWINDFEKHGYTSTAKIKKLKEVE